MGEGGTHGQAVVGEEFGHPVAAFHLVRLQLGALEEPREVGGRGHGLGADVEGLLLQPRQLAQAVRRLGGTRGDAQNLISAPQKSPGVSLNPDVKPWGVRDPSTAAGSWLEAPRGGGQSPCGCSVSPPN